MASSPDLLNQIRSELDARLRELHPLLAEYERLLSAADALASDEMPPQTPRRAVRKAPARKALTRARAKVPVRARAKLPARARASAPGSDSASAAPASAGDSAPASAPTPDGPAPRHRRSAAPKRAQRGAAAIAIVAALEHGSHTVSELAIVTAMRGPIIANNLRRLQQAGTVIRTKREGDGKAAYALSTAPA
jgi:hypothetical protein